MSRSSVGMSAGELASELDAYRQTKVCGYGAGENQTCDCKYRSTLLDAIAAPVRLTSEQTGCCEMRAAVAELRRLADA